MVSLFLSKPNYKNYTITWNVLGKISDELQYVHVNHVSTGKCKAAHHNHERIVPASQSRHLCAGGTEGKELCPFKTIYDVYNMGV